MSTYLHPGEEGNNQTYTRQGFPTCITRTIDSTQEIRKFPKGIFLTLISGNSYYLRCLRRTIRVLSK